MNAKSPLTKPTFLSFFIKALIVSGLIYFAATDFSTGELWTVMLSVLLLSLPIIITGMYSSTIHQIHHLTRFSKKGWLFSLFSRRLLKVIIWTLWAFITAFFMLIQFHTYTPFEWMTLFLTIFVFWLFFSISYRLVSNELKYYFVTNTALTWSRWLTPLIMLMIYASLMLHFENMPVYDSLQTAIDTQKALVVDMNSSDLVWQVSQYLAFYNGIKFYALGHLNQLNMLSSLLILAVGHFVIFYNICAILASLLIPHQEYRRIFGTLSDDDIPPALLTSRIAIVTAVITFLILFIYLPLFAYLEAWVKQTPQITEKREQIEVIALKVEQIGDNFYRENTLAQLEALKLEALHKADIAVAQLKIEADRGFDRVEANVDSYLDWYYSLVGEYVRISKLLMGELEDYMAKQLETQLQQGNPFGDFQTALHDVFTTYETVQQDYQQAAQQLLAKNRIDTVEKVEVDVLQHKSLNEILNPPIHQDIIQLQDRLMGSGAAAGVITALVTKKIVAKIVSKNIIKLAAKSLAKIVLSKTAGSIGGATAGAATGAAIGSIIPGIGTVVGGIVGGVVGGITVGITVDKMLLLLEESMNREAFKQEILASIEEARAEFKAELDNNETM